MSAPIVTRWFAVTHYVGSRWDTALPTGSRTHPWLHSAIPSGFRSKKLTRTLRAVERGRRGCGCGKRLSRKRAVIEDRRRETGDRTRCASRTCEYSLRGTTVGSKAETRTDDRRPGTERRLATEDRRREKREQ